MKKIITTLVIGACMFMFSGVVSAEDAYPTMDWGTKQLTVELPLIADQQAPNLDAENWTVGYNIFALNAKKRTAIPDKQVQMKGIVSADGKYLVIQVDLDGLSPDEVSTRIWARNGKDVWYFCNPFDYYAYPAVDTRTNTETASHEIRTVFSSKTIEKVKVGTEMDKYASNRR